MMLTFSVPHGGKLVNRMDLDYNISYITAEIEMDTIALSDLELIANGAYSPLIGFLGKKDYESILNHMRMANGLVWSIPITLPITEKSAEHLTIGEKVKLRYHDEIYGVLELQEIYTPNKMEEAKKVYQTTDPDHPGVKKVFERPNVYAAGPITLTKIPPKKSSFIQYY